MQNNALAGFSIGGEAKPSTSTTATSRYTGLFRNEKRISDRVSAGNYAENITPSALLIPESCHHLTPSIAELNEYCTVSNAILMANASTSSSLLDFSTDIKWKPTTSATKAEPTPKNTETAKDKDHDLSAVLKIYEKRGKSSTLFHSDSSSDDSDQYTRWKRSSSHIRKYVVRDDAGCSRGENKVDSFGTADDSTPKQRAFKLPGSEVKQLSQEVTREVDVDDNQNPFQQPIVAEDVLATSLPPPQLDKVGFSDPGNVSWSSLDFCCRQQGPFGDTDKACVESSKVPESVLNWECPIRTSKMTSHCSFYKDEFEITYGSKCFRVTGNFIVVMVCAMLMALNTIFDLALVMRLYLYDQKSIVMIFFCMSTLPNFFVNIWRGVKFLTRKGTLCRKLWRFSTRLTAALIGVDPIVRCTRIVSLQESRRIANENDNMALSTSLRVTADKQLDALFQLILATGIMYCAPLLLLQLVMIVKNILMEGSFMIAWHIGSMLKSVFLLAWIIAVYFPLRQSSYNFNLVAVAAKFLWTSLIICLRLCSLFVLACCTSWFILIVSLFHCLITFCCLQKLAREKLFGSRLEGVLSKMGVSVLYFFTFVNTSCRLDVKQYIPLYSISMIEVLVLTLLNLYFAEDSGYGLKINNNTVLHTRVYVSHLFHLFYTTVTVCLYYRQEKKAHDLLLTES